MTILHNKRDHLKIKIIKDACGSVSWPRFVAGKITSIKKITSMNCFFLLQCMKKKKKNKQQGGMLKKNSYK